jgi:hypothetical protein
LFRLADVGEGDNLLSASTSQNLAGSI